MQDRLNIAVFVDYDNIEIGVKSTLRRDFEVSLVLDALKERGGIVAKFAYANWSRQEGATRQMAENAVQMVQRNPSPRGDKNGADINLALDALEMAFTHDHVSAFAIVSGDSDFIPLVNKLREYGKTVYVVGGKAFTSTILQQNCHEFISFESLLNVDPAAQEHAPREQRPTEQRSSEQRFSESLPGEVRAADSRPGEFRERESRESRRERRQRERDERRREREARDAERAATNAGQPQRPALDLALSMPLVERALQVLERRNVQPQLGLLKSTMLQLDSAFDESAYGARSFSDFIDRLKKADYIFVKGGGGRWFIERRHTHPERTLPRPDEALPMLRDVLEVHRLEFEEAGQRADDLAAWMVEEYPEFDYRKYGFQSFNEFLNYAQDRTVVRLEPHPEGGLAVTLGAEFYPPALPQESKSEEDLLTEHDFKQPIVRGQPTATGEIPVIEEPVRPKTTRKRVTRKKSDAPAGDKTIRRTRRKKTD